MTRRKGSVISVVFADVDPEMDDEWNRWYNEEHIPDLLKMPGYLDAARYEAVRGSPRYLAIYEHENFGVFSTPERNAYRDNPPEWTRSIQERGGARLTIRNVYTRIYPETEEPEALGRPMPAAVQVGRMEVPAEIEEKYNHYYDNIRLPQNTALPGCLYARRFHCIEGRGPKYLTLYEFEHENVSQTIAWNEWRKTDTMNDYIGGDYDHAPGSPGVYRRIFPQRSF